MSSEASTNRNPVGPTPPRFVDPRRIGALIGLIGACVFVFSYADGLGAPLAVVAKTAVVVPVSATVWFLFVRPRWIGFFVPAKRWQIGVYLLCVIGEFGVIAIGTRELTALGRLELRPSLIALVVGLHFLPFAWAFGERMFYFLGGALVIPGGLGLLTNSGTGALTAAVASGLAMSLLLLAYSLGMFTGRVPVDDRFSGSQSSGDS